MSARLVPGGVRADLLVIKAADSFLCATPSGDVPAAPAAGEGFYSGDTRVLSELRLRFGEAEPVLLSHAVDSGFRAVVQSTNPDLVDADGLAVAPETVSLRRTLLVDGSLHLHVELRSFLPRLVRLPLELCLATDYADVFEVRGVLTRATRGRMRSPELRGPAVTFGYEGQDGLLRETLIESSEPPTRAEVEGERVRLGFTLELTPQVARSLHLTVTLAADRQRPRRRPLATAARELEREAADWIGACTGIETGSAAAADVLGASLRDLHTLLTPAAGTMVPAAGIPWYVAPFGRDSLLTAFESLVVRPAVARDTLVALARLQADTDDARRDAEPGKILHELRCGELARAGLIPHTPYYGSVDATPLFVVLAAEYWRWTDDLETLTALRPALDRALEWIDRHGDRDGDGFIEYERRSGAKGLKNQGWKDSPDSVVHADGRQAEGPIALVEVQGYVYMAKVGIAEVYAALGESDRARALRAEAGALRTAFHEAFWNPEEGTFALALDGRKRQVAAVTSNPGHCLLSGIVDGHRADAVAERLMAPDMFSGWGIRTLSAENPAFNPLSYHNGSIWPHDTALVAAGLKRYGHDSATARLTQATFEIGRRARDHRLAELYCGFARSADAEVVPYPVACTPQAWAAAAPFLLLQATLGLTPQAPARALSAIRPQLPAGMDNIELRGLRIGSASVTLTFARSGAATGVALNERQGELSVMVDPASPQDAPRGAPHGAAGDHRQRAGSSPSVRLRCSTPGPPYG